MKKIAIVTNGTLPIPATRGGAAEMLLQSILEYNEKSNMFYFSVFSIDDDEAERGSALYRNSSFYYIRTKSLLYKFFRVFKYALNRFFGFRLGNQFISEVTKYRNELNESDLVLIVCNPYYSDSLRRVTSSKIGLYLHNDYINNSKLMKESRICVDYDFVICVSKYVERNVLESVSPNVSVSTVYNGVDIIRFGVKDEVNIGTLRRKFDISDDEKVLIFTGRLVKSKGIKILVEIFIELIKTYKVKLIIVGASGFKNSKRTPFNIELESLSYRAEGKIIYTGYVDHKNINQFYNLADLCVLPSLATEAFPLTTLEAMASGLPVIVSDAGGMPEAVSDECGFVVKRDALFKENIRNKIIELLENPELLSSMSKASKERARIFSEEIYLKNIFNELRSLCR